MSELTPPYCARCRSPCDHVRLEIGIGGYEFWGYRGDNKEVISVSDCHEAELLKAPDLNPAEPMNWWSSPPD